MHDGLHQYLHEIRYYMGAGDLYVHHILRPVYSVAGHLCAARICFRYVGRRMAHQAAGECAVENGLLVGGEYFRTCSHKHPDNSGPKIAGLLVGVCQTGHRVHASRRLVGVEKPQKQIGHFLGRQYPETMGVFDIHDLVAYVVGRLHEPHQRMTRIGTVFMTRYAEFICHPGIYVALGVKKTEFPFFPRVKRGMRIFHD